MLVKVRNMVSNRSGGEVANQFLIETDEAEFFQSYTSVIAKREWGTGKITLDAAKWDYSVTTGKYRNQFLRETKKETEAKIKSGEYTLADLNK